MSESSATAAQRLFDAWSRNVDQLDADNADAEREVAQASSALRAQVLADLTRLP